MIATMSQESGQGVVMKQSTLCLCTTIKQEQLMAELIRYQQGQRWELNSPVAGFEYTLVIGSVYEPHPDWRQNERSYTVYVRYSLAVKESLPAYSDGVILSLNDAGMDRSVTVLVESGVELPWWWVYGRRFESREKAPSGRGSLLCDHVSGVLAGLLAGAQQRLVQIRATKASLSKHREKYGRRTSPPQPSQSVAESWQRIKAWYAENSLELTTDLGSGASETEIEVFEREIGAKLPDDFKESVRIHNGGDWWVPWRYGDLLSLEKILTEWRMYSDWQTQGKYALDNGVWIPHDISGPIKPVFWNKRRIYISDNSGDHLTLDLDPPADGIYGQVLDHSHEVGPRNVVACGWGEFLKLLVDDLESGKYIYIEHEGSLEPVERVERELLEGE